MRLAHSWVNWSAPRFLEARGLGSKTCSKDCCCKSQRKASHTDRGMGMAAAVGAHVVELATVATVAAVAVAFSARLSARAFL
jgi:hypothetical protein